MKRFVAVLIIALFVVGGIFAFSFSTENLKAGAQVGYTHMGLNFGDDTLELGVYVPGISVSGTAEYGITEAIAIKAELGANIYLHPHTSATYGGETHREVADETVPVHFNMYLGGEYGFVLNDRFSVSAGAGFKMMVGKLDSDMDSANVYFGLGMEAVGRYKIDEHFTATAGLQFGWFFANTAEDLTEQAKLVRDAGGHWFEHGVNAYAGVVYSF